MNNKKAKKDKNREKKYKIEPQILTLTMRQKEARKILSTLSELQLTIAYDPIKILFIILQNYIKNGERKNINIPFPMINKRIKGVLSSTINEECWVKLEHEEY